MSNEVSRREMSREEHHWLHELLLELCTPLPTDFEPYGRRSRETDWGPDCSCGCLHFRELERPLGADWGVCSNPKSPRAGMLTFEHQGCREFEYDERIEEDVERWTREHPTSSNGSTGTNCWLGAPAGKASTGRPWARRSGGRSPTGCSTVSLKRKLHVSGKKVAKKTHMSDETFVELMESAEQALEYERGQRAGYCVTRVVVPKPPRPASGDETGCPRKQPLTGE
jgi:hypothetical protein